MTSYKTMLKEIELLEQQLKGGAGSGNFGHGGRPGKRGGSSAGKGGGITTTVGATEQTIRNESPSWANWIDNHFSGDEKSKFGDDDWKKLAQAGRGLLTINELSDHFGKDLVGEMAPSKPGVRNSSGWWNAGQMDTDQEDKVRAMRREELRNKFRKISRM